MTIDFDTNRWNSNATGAVTVTNADGDRVLVAQTVDFDGKSAAFLAAQIATEHNASLPVPLTFGGYAYGKEGTEDRTWLLGPYDTVEDAISDAKEMIESEASGFFGIASLNKIHIGPLKAYALDGDADPIFLWHAEDAVEVS